MTLRAELDVALAALTIKPEDGGTVALAQRYADEIDQGGADLAKIGPPLLAALEALQMSPRARAVAARGVKPDEPAKPSPLDELRERRARKSHPPDLDATAT